MDPEFAREWLQKQAPAFAFIYKWCGEDVRREFDRERAFRAEIARLRELVTSAAGFIEAHGHTLKAHLLLKALNEHDGFDADASEAAEAVLNHQRRSL